tara:strand:- start:97 stop:489 length:393 start_codon:yes stop_codon:yes gene_type:complete
VPLLFSCGEKEDNEIGRYDFEIIEMMDASLIDVIQAAGDISPSLVAGGLLQEGIIIHVICKFDTKTGEIEYFDLLGNEMKEKEILRYKPLIDPFSNNNTSLGFDPYQGIEDEEFEITRPEPPPPKKNLNQ